MKFFYTFLVIFLSLTNVGSNNNMVGSSEPIEDSRKVDELIGVFSTPNELGTVRYTYELYPKEIYYGDPVYLIYYAENISNEIIPNFPQYDFSFYFDFNFLSIENVIIDGGTFLDKYRWIKETPKRSNRHFDVDLLLPPLYPNEKRMLGFTCLDCPPLEDYEHSFWHKLNHTFSPKGFLCNLRIADRKSVV